MKIASIISILMLGSIFSDFHEIARTNGYKEKAYNNYFERDFEGAYFALAYLSDSINLENPGITLNKAHTLYYLGGMGTLMQDLTQKPDSVRQQFIADSRSEYQTLWTSDDATLASIAYNQSGIIFFKTRGDDEVKTLTNSIDMFEEALRKNPFNESARKNFELLKRFRDYPGLIMDRIREMVKQRRYIDAYNLLNEKVTNDPRFADQQEVLKRLSDIVNIETTVKE